MSYPQQSAPPPYSAVDQSQAAPGYGKDQGIPSNAGYAPVPTNDPAYSGMPQPAYSPYYQPPGPGPAPPHMGGPPPMVGPPPMGQPQTVIVTQPVMPQVIVMQFRESPVQMTCPHCNAQIVTSTEYEAGLLTWIVCLVLAFIGCWLFCCLIPFCVDACKDVVHSCPNCQRRISIYKRIN